MHNHVQIVVNLTDDSIREEILARLSLLNFDGFEETEDQLVGYTPEEQYNETEVEELLKQYELTYTKSVIEPQNWNALWESNFQPVLVEDFCSIRAEFHPSLTHTEHEIIITPKMSFGTGHHATTYVMVSEMRKIDLADKKVADFGTGTGILAILAEKLGASEILAIDYDEWSIENAQENIERNNCSHITLKKLDAFSSEAGVNFDIILANINKNVILDNFENMVHALRQNGELLVSGLLKDDETDIVLASQKYQLKHIRTTERNNWISILFKR